MTRRHWYFVGEPGLGRVRRDFAPKKLNVIAPLFRLTLSSSSEHQIASPVTVSMGVTIAALGRNTFASWEGAPPPRQTSMLGGMPTFHVLNRSTSYASSTSSTSPL
jgi:hypothetical protein